MNAEKAAFIRTRNAELSRTELLISSSLHPARQGEDAGSRAADGTIPNPPAAVLGAGLRLHPSARQVPAMAKSHFPEDLGGRRVSTRGDHLYHLHQV